MNKIILSKIFVFLVLFSSFSISNADFKATNPTSNSISFSWTAIENVFIYKILYWLDSSKTVKYDKESDYIEKTSYTLYDLVSKTNYYFTLVWYDETWKEIYKSSEISASTSDKKVVNFESLFIEDAVQVSKNKIELLFSNEISDLNNYDREFKIENVKNPNDVFEVKDTAISLENKKNLLLTLDKEPVVWQDYKLIVLNIRDIYDQNIEFWVNSEAIFKWVEITQEQESKFSSNKDYFSFSELNSAWTNDKDTSSNNVNSTTTSSTNEDKKDTVNQLDDKNNDNQITSTTTSVVGTNTIESWNLAWVELNSANVWNNVLSESEEISKLPVTWPEQIIFVLIAILLSWFIYIYKFIRS